MKFGNKRFFGDVLQGFCRSTNLPLMGFLGSSIGELQVF